ncbi:MAG: CarD family transcriptional regulator [Caldimicrobium sp.]
MFKIGEVVIYPGYGLCKIISIDEKFIEGKSIQAYVLKLLDGEAEIYVPIDSVKKSGLRAIVAKEDLKEIYKILSQREVKITNGNWNKRYKEYTEKLKRGDAFILASLVKELYELSKRKTLSFGERKVFERAKELLVLELSFCENCSPEEIENKLQEILNSQEEIF